MRIYRVHLKRQGWESDGFAYFLLKRDAKACLKQNTINVNISHESDDQVEIEDVGGEYGKIDAFDFPMNKKGILGLLIKVASHPDNG